MPGHVIAAMNARESTRRKLTEPPREPRPRRTRRATALVLQSVAHRLDPCVTAPARIRLER
jgi:hypothetical protein